MPRQHPTMKEIQPFWRCISYQTRWFFQLAMLPSKKLAYPELLEKEKHLPNRLWRGHVSFQEGNVSWGGNFKTRKNRSSKKWKDRLPTVHFQVLSLLVFLEVNFQRKTALRCWPGDGIGSFRAFSPGKTPVGDVMSNSHPRCDHDQEVYYIYIYIHPRSLTVRPLRMMVGRRSFPCGMVYFQGRAFKLPGGKGFCT